MIETQLHPRQAMAACLAQWRDSIAGCDDAGLRDQVRDLESVSRMLHSVMLTAVAELDSRNVAVNTGFRSTKRLLAGMLHISATEAGTRVAHATALAPRRTLGGGLCAAAHNAPYEQRWVMRSAWRLALAGAVVAIGRCA